MMVDPGVCPRCAQRIELERKREAVVVCSACGFVQSSSEHRLAETSHRKFVNVGVGLCLFFVAALVQISVWDNYCLEVIPLQIKEMTGMSQDKDFERMAQICLERKRLNCVETQYAHLSKKDPKQLLRLGKLQMSREHYQDAVKTYKNYFKGGQKDLEATYNFAKALGQVGQIEEARKHYLYILNSRPDAILHAAAQNAYEKLQKPAANRGIASIAPNSR